MTVGELKRLIEDLDDDMDVVTGRYNSGYGGLFDADAEVLEDVEVGPAAYRREVNRVLLVGPRC